MIVFGPETLGGSGVSIDKKGTRADGKIGTVEKGRGGSIGDSITQIIHIVNGTHAVPLRSSAQVTIS